MLLIDARRTAELTQIELANRLCKPQSFVSKYENGERRLDVIEFISVCSALKISPTSIIQKLWEDSLVASHGLSAPCIFGSVLTRTDTENSDLDLLVEPSDTTTLFALASL